MIWACIFSIKSACETPFTVPSVPTGIKIGVWITPWSVLNEPNLALVEVDSFFKVYKLKLVLIIYEGDSLMCILGNSIT